MNNSKFQLLFISILLSCISIFAQNQKSFQYISPKPDSKFLSRATNIILNHTENINTNSLQDKNLILVIGSETGKHSGELILSDDGKTIVFNPFELFAPGENVTVRVNHGIQTISGKNVQPIVFTFSITPLEEPIRLDPVERLGLGFTSADLRNAKLNIYNSPLDSLPPDFPSITTGTINDPSDGNIFLTNFTLGPNDSSGFYITIADNDGNVIKYKRMEPLPAFDFKVQPNGFLSYADVDMFFGGYGYCQYKLLDTSLVVVDSFKCGNGYFAELHDFQILPNGHALMFAYDPQPYDMSKIVPGGDPNAIVIGGIIQELDENKNVVFQWRSWDYIPVTDSYADLTRSTIDYVHLNAIEGDNDGNILFIGRNLSGVTKISRATGEIIWRLGGKQNNFTFINEHPENAPDYISRPHDIRRIDNGNITLFDNGDDHNPPYSRGVEYMLDEDAMTATLVWEYQHDPDIYSFAMGSVQRLPNGNTLIGWGSASASGEAVFTEVHPDKSVALEFFYPIEVSSYRAFKFPWASGLPIATVYITELYEGNTYTFNNSTDTTGVKIKFNELTSVLYNRMDVERFKYAPANPEFTGRAPQVYPTHCTIVPTGITSLNVDIWFNLNYYPEVTEPETTVVYHRPIIGSGVFTAIPTTYLAGTNELKVTGMTEVGEFTFGYPDIPVVVTVPDLVLPVNNSLVNENIPLELKWSPRGFTNHQFHLQVSTDDSFNSLVVDDSTITSLTYTLATLLQNQQYYWRVKSKNIAGWGDWSVAWSFTTSASFLDLIYPDGGETWQTDTSLTIHWDHNILDSVTVELFKNDSFYRTIVDSLYSVTGGYRWTLTDSIPDGSDYKIKVSTLDGSLQDISTNTFTIIYKPVKVENDEQLARDFRLEQNYPNPFNPVTTINYSLPSLCYISMNIFNSLGERIIQLVNFVQGKGNYNVNWDASNYASGIYFYSIDATTIDGSNRFRSVRKMILLK